MMGKWSPFQIINFTHDLFVPGFVYFKINHSQLRKQHNDAIHSTRNLETVC